MVLVLAYAKNCNQLRVVAFLPGTCPLADVGLTRAHFSDEELANYQQQGREAILQSIPGLGIEETARANAAKVLVPMLTQLGYDEQNITIAFRDDFDMQSVLKLIKYDEVR